MASTLATTTATLIETSALGEKADGLLHHPHQHTATTTSPTRMDTRPLRHDTTPATSSIGDIIDRVRRWETASTYLYRYCDSPYMTHTVLSKPLLRASSTRGKTASLTYDRVLSHLQDALECTL
jgi:hypothetical protein